MVDNRQLRVLVPLDGSEEAESVLQAIQPLLQAREVRLTLLRVARPQDTGDSGRLYLSQMRRTLLLDGIRCETRSEWGFPAEEILYQGAPPRCDLIAMATHGRSGLRRAFMGSVAEEVVRHSRTPVLVNRPPLTPRSWSRIVVGLDGSTRAEVALADALRLAAMFASVLHLVRAEVPAQLLGTSPSPEALAYLRRMCARAWSEGVAAVPVLREGPPAHEIGAVAQEVGAGLIVLSTHGRSGLPRMFFGSTAEEVLRTAPCPVLVRRTVEVPVEAPIETE